MISIEKDIELKIEKFTENILSTGSSNEFYPDIVFSDSEPDGYNNNGDGTIIPKSIFLDSKLFCKKKDFLSQYNNTYNYSDKELLAVYYYYVLTHEATHKVRDNQGYDITAEDEEQIADKNAIDLTIEKFKDVFCLYLSIMLCNKIDQAEIDENIKKNNISQDKIEADTHYSTDELLNYIKSKGEFTNWQEDIINLLK